MWVIQTLNTGVYISIRAGKGSKRSAGKKYDKSGAGEEGYAAICAGCEVSERNERVVGAKRIRIE